MTDQKPFPPVFATNRPATGETVADEVNRMLRGLRSELANPPDLALATAYLNPAGFSLIADEVEQAPHVRILLGADPEEPFRSQVERGSAVSFAEVAERHAAGLSAERDLLGFTVEADAAARRLVAWLRACEAASAPRVEVRRFTKGFLHGKAFIAQHPKMPAVLAGSSNLTFAGLARNRELNLGYPSGRYTELVIDWFDELWAESEPFDLAALYEARWQPHSPEVVFLRMLHELYGRTPAHELARRIELPVTEFQRDGIVRAMRIMDALGGVLVCDEVGLGKTFIAGELVRVISQEERQKVLIVVPAALKESTWKPFLHRFDLVSARVSVVTYDDLRLGTKPEVQHLDDYAFVVIDEAHNLRNPNALRAEAVMNLMRSKHPKKVMLLTATPVNNSLRDLQTLISYFVGNDGQFAARGIPSISAYIAAAERMNPEALSPEHLFDLMDEVAVRRTRHFIKREYQHDQIRDNRGELIPIVFPTPVVERVTYELDPRADALVERVIHALAVSDDEELVIRSGSDRDPTRLSLARYAPSLYGRGLEVDRLEITNVGLLRSNLLKRLESSTAALVATIERLVASHEAFLDALGSGYVLTGDALREYVAADAENLDAFLDGVDARHADHVRPAADFDADALRADVEGDVVLLRELLTDARARHAAGPDDKVHALVERLGTIAAAAARPDSHGVAEEDRRKIIVFSTYSDTVEDLRDRLVEAIDSAPADSPIAAYRGRVGPAIFGSRGGYDQQDRAAAIAAFCPKTAGELDEDGRPRSPDLYDILVATDVLAEGVNLQQAGQLVCYDLPFNPMRLVQRYGRIDRIGSPHRYVHNGVFWPATNLDRWLNIIEILQRKIAYANAAVGVGEVLPGQVADPSIEVVFQDERAIIEGLYAGDAGILVEGAGNAALSGEEYRRRLDRAFRDPTVRRMVLELPYGSGSGLVSKRIRQPGYVFCARIGDQPVPWFRFVAADPLTWSPRMRPGAEPGQTVPWVDADTLTCLVASDPGAADGGEQVMPPAAEAGVFAAWECARADIHDRWSFLADPANVQPQIELALRQAVQLVAENGGFLGPDAQGDLAARLNGKWSNDIVRAVRAIVRDEERSASERVTALQKFVADTGLAIPAMPEALPPARLDDIRLVCWMAVQPAPVEGPAASVRP